MTQGFVTETGFSVKAADHSINSALSSGQVLGEFTELRVNGPFICHWKRCLHPSVLIV